MWDIITLLSFVGNLLEYYTCIGERVCFKYPYTPLFQNAIRLSLPLHPRSNWWRPGSCYCKTRTPKRPRVQKRKHNVARNVSISKNTGARGTVYPRSSCVFILYYWTRLAPFNQLDVSYIGDWLPNPLEAAGHEVRLFPATTGILQQIPARLIRPANLCSTSTN